MILFSVLFRPAYRFLSLAALSAALLFSCESELIEPLPVSTAGHVIPKDLFDCPGDVDGDGLTTVADFVIMVSYYQEECADCPADLDGNGVVDAADFVQFNSAWNNPCGLQGIQVSVYPVGARFRFGNNDYPAVAVDPPVPDGSNLALGGVTITGVLADGSLYVGSVLSSDSLRIDINGGDGATVSHQGEVLEGRTIRQVRSITADNHYGYWRMSGRDDICMGTMGQDYDYVAEYFGLLYKVTYTLYYSIPGYPTEMSGTAYALGLYETPIDGSCLDTDVFLAYPYSYDGLYEGPSYMISD